MIFAVVGVVVLAAAAIVAIVLLSGGDDKESAAKASTPAASASTTTGASDAPSTAKTASSASVSGALTCADIQGNAIFRDQLEFKTGGTKPTGIELPSGNPTLSCAGTTTTSPPTQLTALAWSKVTLSGYVAQLTAAGWTDAPSSGAHVLDKSGSKYEIVALTINANLVAVYGPSS